MFNKYNEAKWEAVIGIVRCWSHGRDVCPKDNKIMYAPVVINAQIINRGNGMCLLIYNEICPINFEDVQLHLLVEFR
jgi:hypothetical protein